MNALGPDVESFQIALYGLPPAGVLALELLQHSRNSTRVDRLFPRSEIIQSLSVLISSVDCIVRPTSGNYTICSQAKKMLQAILDTVLLPERHDVQMDYREQVPEHVNQLAGVDLENQMWFDSELDMDFWMSLEDHPLLAWPEPAGDA